MKDYGFITLDFETYYSKEYSLSKMTTEEYLRDPRFQVIGVGVKVNAEPTEWFEGPLEAQERLREIDWSRSGVLAQNTMFDAGILSWHYNIRPKVLFDTMGMSRATYGVHVSHSLKAIAQRLGLGQKGEEVVLAMGLRYEDFDKEQLARYGLYCINDVDLTYAAFQKMLPGFPKSELQLIDLTLRMFTEPVLELDVPALEAHLERTIAAKEALLEGAGADKSDIMSNDKFAELLRQFGVEPPTKISAKTGKVAYAFAKTDQGLRDLAEHEDPQVQALVAARLGNKSTLEETRTQRFIDIGKRGRLAVPLQYYGAHTGRWSGKDGINLQNLPSRGKDAKAIKKAIKAPEGYTVIDCDSSQIEARVLAWLAEQNDLVYAFERKEDAYKKMAVKIYGIDEVDVDKEQRQVGKAAVLGAGYGMGGDKFQIALKGQYGVTVENEEAKRIIAVYREANPMIVQLWREADAVLKGMARGLHYGFGREGVLDVGPGADCIILPNGLTIPYPGLRFERDEESGRDQMIYDTRNGPARIYGPKCVENVVQALARIVVGDQMRMIAKRYRPALTVHDSVILVVRDEELDEAVDYVTECMSRAPGWAEGLPVACEANTGKTYGDC